MLMISEDGKFLYKNKSSAILYFMNDFNLISRQVFDPNSSRNNTIVKYYMQGTLIKIISRVIITDTFDD